MKCDRCNMCLDKDMAQIPYIEHEHRMFKAYQRESRLKEREEKLKGWLIATNVVWFIVAILCLIVG